MPARSAIIGAFSLTQVFIAGAVSLSGKGPLTFNDSSHNEVATLGSDETLTNGGIISGAADFDDSHLTVRNLAAGQINAVGTHSLLFTGGH